MRGGKPLVLGGPGRSVRPHHRRGTRGPAPPRTHCAGAGGRPERSLPVGRGPGRRFASFPFSQYPSKQLWLPACPRRSLSRAQPAVGTGALREAACLLGGSCHIGKRGRGQRPCPPKLREHGTARRQAACGPQTPPRPAACAASARRGPGGAGTDTTHVPPGADANATLSSPVAAGSQAQTVTPAPKPFHFPSPREREGSHHGVLLVTGQPECFSESDTRTCVEPRGHQRETGRFAVEQEPPPRRLRPQ